MLASVLHTLITTTTTHNEQLWIGDPIIVIHIKAIVHPSTTEQEVCPRNLLSR